MLTQKIQFLTQQLTFPVALIPVRPTNKKGDTIHMRIVSPIRLLIHVFTVNSLPYFFQLITKTLSQMTYAIIYYTLQTTRHLVSQGLYLSSLPPITIAAL